MRRVRRASLLRNARKTQRAQKLSAPCAGAIGLRRFRRGSTPYNRGTAGLASQAPGKRADRSARMRPATWASPPRPRARTVHIASTPASLAQWAARGRRIWFHLSPPCLPCGRTAAEAYQLYAACVPRTVRRNNAYLRRIAAAGRRCNSVAAMHPGRSVSDGGRIKKSWRPRLSFHAMSQGTELPLFRQVFTKVGQDESRYLAICLIGPPLAFLKPQGGHEYA